ncbi:hypothetical protein PAN31108_04365 [Pandoraea anhela]|uniref:Uncharacterized protein n=2 Tax=Pandoraea anhela TaxID=2508295 RepID=A0A5E4Y8H8_9BURK|nr:hypothetical protein PAN31108_04365 [Pandoraea anhela]
MLVSEMEKNPEQMIRKATAQICAHKGKASKLFDAQSAAVAMSRHYIRGDTGIRFATRPTRAASSQCPKRWATQERS